MANKRPVSTMIIALGGSGAWAMIHAKKAILDAYGNEIPDNVALVALDTLATVDKTTAHVGSKTAIRKNGEGIGGVRLEASEYAHLGGNVRKFIEDIAETDSYAHIASWFQAKWKLENLKPGQFNLDAGAGMFRQMGRLALFYDLLNPANSAAKNRIENKLVAIGNTAEADKSVSVMIVGSLTGGTGAGLFIDVAHIVRQVAKTREIPVVIRGFFFLPQTFQKVLNDSALEQARQRSYAAMRELERFVLHEDAKFGYEMHYVASTAGMDQRVYRSEVKEKLYDFVYLIDGEGQRKKLNSKTLEIASAPMVGDAIVAYIDHHYGNYQSQYINNINSAVSARQLKSGKQAYVGSIGSYSIVLPIQNMIEGWSYRLSLDTIRTLVPPARTTQSRDHIVDLSADHNLERSDTTPLRETEQFLTSEAGVPDPTDKEGRRAFVPAPLWRYALDFHNELQYSRDQAMAPLLSKGVDEWLRILRPSAQTADDVVSRVLLDTQAILDETAQGRIKTSDERKADPKTDHRNVKRQAEDFMHVQLGRVERGGRHEGGEYGNALRRLSKAQVDHFRETMAAYIANTLNGETDDDPVKAKQGKLGWLMKVIEEMRRIFDSAQNLVLQVSRAVDINDNKRQSMTDGLEAAADEMKDAASRRNLNPFGTPPGIAAQQSYLAQVQDYIDFHRKLLLQDYIRHTLNQFKEVTDQIQEQFNQWKRVLATDNASLYTVLLDGSRRIENEKDDANRVYNRWVIDDPTWEDERYKEMVEREDNADVSILSQWVWQSHVTKNTRGELVISIDAALDGQSIYKDMKGLWSEDNRNVMLVYARHIFGIAVKQFNVLNYLMSSHTANGPEGERLNFVGQPELLGSFLARQCGHQLAIGPGAEEVITNAILADVDETAGNNPSRMTPKDFLQQVLNQLAEDQGAGGDDDATNQRHKILDCDDPFRLTLISGAEVVPIGKVAAYLDNKSDYMRLVKDARKVMHIFPAEVSIVDLEERLPTLRGQKRRVINVAIVDLFEHRSRLRQFLYLVAYGIVRRFSIQHEGESAFYWGLEVPSTAVRGKGNEIIWLTEPSPDPHFLGAARTYVLLKKDIRSFRQQGAYDTDIPDSGKIEDYLKEVRQNECQKRIANDSLAYDIHKIRAGYDPEKDHPFDAELRQWIEAFMPPLALFRDEDTDEEFEDFDWEDFTPEAKAEFEEVAEIVVQHDTLDELAFDLEAHLPERRLRLDTQRQSHATDLGHEDVSRAEAEYDFFSVAVLELEEQLQVLRKTIRARYRQHEDITDWGGVTDQ